MRSELNRRKEEKELRPSSEKELKSYPPISKSYRQMQKIFAWTFAKVISIETNENIRYNSPK